MQYMEERLPVANAALASFSIARIERRPGGLYVCWSGRDGRPPVAKRWQCRGQDFYPVWHHQYPGGGTSSTALAQLIRWLRNQPVLPAASWRYWASETCGLLPMQAVDDLLAGGYPEFADCVLCSERITGGHDWWSLDGVSGPCCNWRSGCRQKGTTDQKAERCSV